MGHCQCGADFAPTLNAREIGLMPNFDVTDLDVDAFTLGASAVDALLAVALPDVEFTPAFDVSNIDPSPINALLSSPLPVMLEDVPLLDLHTCEVALLLVDAPAVCAMCGHATASPSPARPLRPRG